LQVAARAAELARRVPRDPAVARLLSGAHTQLGDVYAMTGRVKEVEGALRQALEAVRRMAPHRRDRALALADEAEVVVRLGVLYRDVGPFGRAEEMFRETVRLYEQAILADPSDMRHQQALAACQGLFGDLYKTTGQLARARELYAGALAAWARRAENHPDVPEYQ
jgi:tetratricopeptide (TPR) repeat protein